MAAFEIDNEILLQIINYRILDVHFQNNNGETLERNANRDQFVVDQLSKWSIKKYERENASDRIYMNSMQTMFHNLKVRSKDENDQISIVNTILEINIAVSPSIPLELEFLYSTRKDRLLEATKQFLPFPNYPFGILSCSYIQKTPNMMERDKGYDFKILMSLGHLWRSFERRDVSFLVNLDFSTFWKNTKEIKESTNTCLRMNLETGFTVKDFEDLIVNHEVFSGGLTDVDSDENMEEEN